MDTWTIWRKISTTQLPHFQAVYYMRPPIVIPLCAIFHENFSSVPTRSCIYPPASSNESQWLNKHLTMSNKRYAPREKLVVVNTRHPDSSNQLWFCYNLLQCPPMINCPPNASYRMTNVQRCIYFSAIIYIYMCVWNFALHNRQRRHRLRDSALLKAAHFRQLNRIRKDTDVNEPNRKIGLKNVSQWSVKEKMLRNSTL